MKIKDIPISERPREKLIKYGKENLSDAELLSLILKTGTKEENVLMLSMNILKEIKKLENIKEISYEKLIKIKGIGKAKAISILAISELSKRIYYENEIQEKEKYTTPEVIYQKNKYLFDNKKQEYFYCLYLNSKKELIERKLLFMGTINKSVVHPREVFKEAYQNSASSIICMHNHPSGDPSPSSEDIILTEALMQIGKINQIPVVDHIIFTEKEYYSFYENSRHQRML